jgi:hypothetical protein
MVEAVETVEMEMAEIIIRQHKMRQRQKRIQQRQLEILQINYGNSAFRRDRKRKSLVTSRGDR